ncbi:hypothetical protein [Streptomyces sp. 16-176A]|uniref:hypothetical protein n=1 Tax=Streptomyces sp. 16-176A TaxID=2530458 RepID=UPI00345D4515
MTSVPGRPLLFLDVDGPLIPFGSPPSDHARTATASPAPLPWWSGRPISPTDEGPHGLHWKTRCLVEWADGRPFIWVDDEITAMDRLPVDAACPGPSLLHGMDPTEGLTEADLFVLADWIHAVTPD